MTNPHAIKFEAYEYRIPVWALVAIVNNDWSAIDGLDEIELKGFLKQVFNDHGLGHWSYPDDIDEAKYFAPFNDVHNLGDEVIDCHYMASRKA